MLLALLFSLTASASTLPSLPFLRVDLDADGRADLVRVLEGSPGSAYHVLEVALSRSGKVARFERLVGRLFDELSQAEQEQGSICSSLLRRSLKAGRNGGFVLEENRGDYGGCYSESSRGLEIRVVRGEIVVTKLDRYSRFWSMGDPSYTSKSSFDFARRSLSGSSYESHSGHGAKACPAGRSL